MIDEPLPSTSPELPHRVVRVAMPVALVRQVDRVVLEGQGSFASRTDFILDAISERLQDFPPQAATPAPLRSIARPTASPDPGRQPAVVDFAIRDTRRGWVADPTPMPGSSDQPLLGFHNRDFPSVWALAWIAARTSTGPMRWRDLEAGLVQAAWDLGAAVARAVPGNRAATALLPTNWSKSKQAESAFLGFAVGQLRNSAGNGPRLSGPAFTWSVLGTVVDGDDLHVGVTRAGWDLLEALEGLEAIGPHSFDHAATFLKHLHRHARGDLGGFRLLLRSLQSGTDTRDELLRVFEARWSGRSPAENATTLAGYVARAREWGLVEPRQTAGRYVITSAGTQLGTQLEEGGTNEGT